MKKHCLKNYEDEKNRVLRKRFISRKSVCLGNVLDKSKKFTIEELFDIPRAESKPEPKRVIQKTSSNWNFEPLVKDVREMPKTNQKVYTVNPNLNSNFTINTFSLANLRLRKYTYNPSKNLGKKLKKIK